MLIHLEHETLFSRNERAIPPFALRVRPHLEALGFNHNKIFDLSYPKIPPWTAHRPNVNFEIAKYVKDSTTNEEYRSLFKEAKSKYQGYKCIYTDGSKKDDRWLVGWLLVFRDPSAQLKAR